MAALRSACEPSVGLSNPTAATQQNEFITKEMEDNCACYRDRIRRDPLFMVCPFDLMNVLQPIATAVACWQTENNKNAASAPLMDARR